MPTAQEIAEFYEANRNDPAAIQAAMAQYGVTPEQASTATGQNIGMFQAPSSWNGYATDVFNTVKPGGMQWAISKDTDLIAGGPTGYVLSNSDLEKWFKENPDPAQWAAEAARRGLTVEETAAAIMKGTNGAYDTKAVLDYINGSDRYGFQDSGRILNGFGAKSDPNSNGMLRFAGSGNAGSPVASAPARQPSAPARSADPSAVQPHLSTAGGYEFVVPPIGSRAEQGAGTPVGALTQVSAAPRTNADNYAAPVGSMGALMRVITGQDQYR